jgi:hypothetical protein
VSPCRLTGSGSAGLKTTRSDDTQPVAPNGLAFTLGVTSQPPEAVEQAAARVAVD